MQIKLMIPNYIQLQLHATRVANILEFQLIFLAQWVILHQYCLKINCLELPLDPKGLQRK